MTPDFFRQKSKSLQLGYSKQFSGNKSIAGVVSALRNQFREKSHF